MLGKLALELIEAGCESEWIEFKESNENPERIGKNVSAIANSALLHNQDNGYILYGVEDETLKIVGTRFKPLETKVKGNELLQSWLTRLLNPRIDIRLYDFELNGYPMAIIVIPVAQELPVRFKNLGYIRIGSSTTKLSENPQMEKKIWEKLQTTDFESQIAMGGIEFEDLEEWILYQRYFELLKIPVPMDF